MDFDLKNILISVLNDLGFQIALLAIICLIFISLVGFIISYIQFLKLKRAGIVEIDKMSGLEFEKFLESLFLRQGFKVEHVGVDGSDFGADLILEKDNIRTVVQAKRYSNKVGIKSIQEVVGAKLKYKCSRAMLVTNSYLTKAAWELGRVNFVTIWTRKKLIEEILKVRDKDKLVK